MILPSTASTMAGQLLMDGSFHLAAFDAIAFAGPDPVNDLAAPPFNGTQRAAARRYGLSRSAVRTFRKKCNRRADHLDRLADFIDANLHAVPHITRLVDRDFEGQLAIAS
jgi:hypothetical protein